LKHTILDFFRRTKIKQIELVVLKQNIASSHVKTTICEKIVNKTKQH